jgi:hypothetical protein
MTKLFRRIQRIADVASEHKAALAAETLLAEKLKADPNFGERLGWEQRHADRFKDNLLATYLIRMYAEYEATVRDYWRTHLGQQSYPTMHDLVNHAIPNQRFPRDWIDDANGVRVYRNFLVHEVDDEPPEDMLTFTIEEAKKHLCAYVSCFDRNWE